MGSSGVTGDFVGAGVVGISDGCTDGLGVGAGVVGACVGPTVGPGVGVVVGLGDGPAVGVDVRRRSERVTRPPRRRVAPGGGVAEGVGAVEARTKIWRCFRLFGVSTLLATFWPWISSPVCLTSMRRASLCLARGFERSRAPPIRLLLILCFTTPTPHAVASKDQSTPTTSPRDVTLLRQASLRFLGDARRGTGTAGPLREVGRGETHPGPVANPYSTPR